MPYAVTCGGMPTCRRASVDDRAPTGSWFLPLYCVGSETCTARGLEAELAGQGGCWHAGPTNLLVVVQYDNHVGVQKAGVVHSLVRHPAGDSTIPNDRNAVVLAALEVPANRHTERRRHRRGAVAGAKGVVRRLRTLGEP